MAPIREALKVMQGAVLVAREAAISSQRLQHLRSGDVRSFLVSLLNSATDLTGLTSGHPRPYSPQDPPTTVVYFPHSIDSDSDSKDNNDPSSSIAPDQAAASSESAIPSTSQSDASSSRAIPSRDDAKIKARRDIPRREPRERSVPTTSIGRAIGFAGLGAGLAWGTVQESAKRIIFGNNNSTTNHQNLSPLLSDQNAERLASTLCRMRGAALKAGQMLSIQDESLIPEPLLSALEAVRQGADIMPRKQLDKVLAAELGPDWQTKLKVFDYKPLASASIGQVHKAVTRNDLEIAMKIQYPGVAESIDSDIENVRRLLQYTNLIPKGLFLDQAMKVAKVELARECDYILEAENQKRYHKLLYRVEGFYVPRVIAEISSKRVLSTELVTGISVEKVAYLKQETRDYVGRKLLELTLKELFEFRFMQTDPNWGNFLYDEEKNVINLIDFGAAREYPKQFVDDYLRMVFACADCNKEEVIKMSCRLGFLTGEESEIMLDAHSKAAFIVGLPFSKPGLFDFKSANVTGDISGLGATMLKHRMKPPPDEVYSLHRKLSGAFLACIKLGAVVPCRDMLLDVYHSYNFSDLETDQMVSTGVA